MKTDNFSTLHHVPLEKKTIAVDMPDGSPWIKLPLGNEMLDADFDRQSYNLILETQEARVVVENYFASDSFPALLSETGKKIAGTSVQNLAGPDSPLEYAGPVEMGGESIGVVEKLKGVVTVNRNGQEIELEQGDLVFQNDVIETEGDGSIGITFEDGSVFTLGAEARMTLDEFVYDPDTGDGSSSVNVIKGMFKFVSGEIAANNPGEMQVETPVATIGIRGTTGGGSVQGEGADNQFFLEPNADGTVGWFDVTTAQGTTPMNQPNTMVGLTSFNDVPPPPQFVSPNQIKQAFSQVVEFSPAGKYDARQNNNSEAVNDPKATNNQESAPNTDAQQNDASEEGAPDGEASEGGDQQEASGEETAEAEGEAPEGEATEGEKNAADAKQEGDNSGADSEVSANGEQSGEALESFSGNENFDGEASGGESGDAPEGEPMNAASDADAPEGDGQPGEPHNDVGPEGEPMTDSAGPMGTDAAPANQPPAGEPSPQGEFIATSTASEGGPTKSGFKTASEIDNASTQTGTDATAQPAPGPNGQQNPLSGTNTLQTGTTGSEGGEVVKEPIKESNTETNNNEPLTTSSNNTNTNTFLQNQIAAEQEQTLLQQQQEETLPPPPPPEGEVQPLPGENTTTAPGGPEGQEQLPPPPPEEEQPPVQNNQQPPVNNAVPAIYDLTGTADNFVGDGQDTLFKVSTAAFGNFMSGNDTLDGGAGVNTLHFEAQGASYSLDMNTTPFANITDIERFEFNDAGVNFILDSGYLNFISGDGIIINNHAHAISLDLNSYQGAIALEGTGAVQVSSAGAVDYFFKNASGTSVNLDLSNSSGDDHVHLTGGGNNVTSGTGDFSLYQDSGTGHVIDASQASYVNVALENVNSSVVTGSGAANSLYFIENSVNVTMALSGGGNDVILDNVSGSTIDGSAASYLDTYITGSGSALEVTGASNYTRLDIEAFDGDVTGLFYGTTDVYFRNLLNNTTIDLKDVSSSDISLDFADILFNNFSIQVVDVDTDGNWDMQLTLSGSRDIILHDFFANNGSNDYTMHIGDEVRNLTNAQYENYAMGEMLLTGLLTAGDTIDVAGNIFTVVASGATGNQIDIAGNTVDMLNNIVTAINGAAIGYTASYDSASNKIFIACNASGVLESLSVSAANIAITTDMNYQTYFQAKGTVANHHEELGVTSYFGSVFDDHLNGGQSQTVAGMDGDDAMFANANDATLYGGDGNDIFSKTDGASAWNNKFAGDAGIDTVDYSNFSGPLTIYLDSNNTTGTGFNDELYDIEVVIGSSGNDSITGSSVADNTIEGGAGADSIVGGAGTVDTASYKGSAGAVNINLDNGNATGADAQGDILANINNLEGSLFSDDLTGDTNDNVLEGLAGNDTLTADYGADTMIGGAGDDLIVLGSYDAARDIVELASSGVDTIVNFDFTNGSNDIIDLSDVSVTPSADNYFDLLYAGKLNIHDDGTDLIVQYGVGLSDIGVLQGESGSMLGWKHFLSGDGFYYASDSDDGASDSSVRGGDHSDVLLADAAGRTLEGYHGNDILSNNGNTGITMYGDDGNDVLVLDDITANVSLYGGDGDLDTLYLEDANVNQIDLNAFLTGNTVSEIERIDLNGLDMVNVTEDDILTMSDMHELLVTGDGSESITLDSSKWTLTSAANLPQHIEAEAGYSTYIAQSASDGPVALHVDNSLIANVSLV